MSRSTGPKSSRLVRIFGIYRPPADRPSASVKSTELTVHTGRRRGVFDISRECAEFVAGAGDGLLNVFVPHATAGLVIMESGSGSTTTSLDVLDRLLPRDERGLPPPPWVAGTRRRPPRPAARAPTLTVPVVGGRMALGTWQSICLLDPNADNATRTVRLSFVAG